jgi:hypothetical protein
MYIKWINLIAIIIFIFSLFIFLVLKLRIIKVIKRKITYKEIVANINIISKDKNNFYYKLFAERL